MSELEPAGRRERRPTAAALVALVVAPHPLLAGLGFGAGVFVVLMVMFFAIAAVLHAQQRRSWRG
jgi:hypothetical protein